MVPILPARRLGPRVVPGGQLALAGPSQEALGELRPTASEPQSRAAGKVVTATQAVRLPDPEEEVRRGQGRMTVRRVALPLPAPIREALVAAPTMAALPGRPTQD